MTKRDIAFICISCLLAMAVVMLHFSKRTAQSIACCNQAASIAFSARIWASDDDHHQMADNFMCMSNEIETTKVFICPGDKIHEAADNWNVFTTNNTSYKIVGPNQPDDDYSNAYVRCTIHGNLGFADGTYFDGHSRRTKF